MSQIKITPRCLDEDLPRLPKEVQIDFFDKIDTLAAEPEYGKPLRDELWTFRSISLGRYRIVYYYMQEADVVWIIAAGIRKEGSREDIYRQVIRLLQAGKIELE
jgi:mRNA interferase RelE/StbE